MVAVVGNPVDPCAHLMNENNELAGTWVVVINTPDFVVEENLLTEERRIIQKEKQNET